MQNVGIPGKAFRPRKQFSYRLRLSVQPFRRLLKHRVSDLVSDFCQSCVLRLGRPIFLVACQQTLHCRNRDPITRFHGVYMPRS